MASIDVSKFKTSDWLKVVGGAVFLIFGFVKWWGIKGVDGGANAFDYFFTGTIPWIIFVAIGVLTFLAAAKVFSLPRSFPTPLVFLAAAALGTLLVLIRFFSDGFDDGGLGIDIPTERGIGLYLCFIAAIVVLVGTFFGFKEAGGELSDLTDVDKLKRAFNSGDSSHGSSGTTPPPPPPPAAGTPPPPPPPVV